jgi:hypothetical protein
VVCYKHLFGQSHRPGHHRPGLRLELHFVVGVRLSGAIQGYLRWRRGRASGLRTDLAQVCNCCIVRGHDLPVDPTPASCHVWAFCIFKSGRLEYCLIRAASPARRVTGMRIGKRAYQNERYLTSSANNDNLLAPSRSCRSPVHRSEVQREGLGPRVITSIRTAAILSRLSNDGSVATLAYLDRSCHLYSTNEYFDTTND